MARAGRLRREYLGNIEGVGMVEAVRLARVETGEGPGAALLIAHGLFGSARNWGAMARRLGTDRRVVAVDMRNHGVSPRGRAGYEEMAADLAAAIEETGAPMDVLGHSMGGKAAMVLALTRPELVRRLVVGDIAPAIYGHTQMPLIEAMRALDLAALDSRRAADRALTENVPEAAVRAFLLQSLELRAEGGPRWAFDLEALAEGMARILGFPEVSGRFDGPVLFLAGDESDYLIPDHEQGIRALFPAAQIGRLPGAGHWLHAEAPDAFETAVRGFLDRAAT